MDGINGFLRFPFLDSGLKLLGSTQSIQRGNGAKHCLGLWGLASVHTDLMHRRFIYSNDTLLM